MKKILFAVNIVMFSLLLFSYKENGNAAMDEESPIMPTDYQLGVPVGLAKVMLKNYKNTIWNQRRIDSDNLLDARSAWFSLGKLQAFIDDIKAKVASNGCKIDTNNDIGIRIYYGVYPKAGADWKTIYDGYFKNHKLPASYGKLHSLLLVPTFWDKADGFHYDFDPRKMNDNNSGICTPAPLENVMANLMNPEKPLTSLSRLLQPQNVIRRDLAYMMIPDNLDNKRFVRASTRVVPIDSGITSQYLSGTASISISPAQPLDADFTNGGNLTPPPYTYKYPEGGWASPPGVTAREVPTNSSYVPSSGAALMRWVDGTSKPGWYLSGIYSGNW